MLSFLMHLHPPQDETSTLPPISALTPPCTSTSLPLTIFTLLQRPQDETMIPPSPLLTLLHPCLIFSSSYNPYGPRGPSSYASDTALTPP
ncbi:hypothetical protein O181_031617 [Austropuccinia psidii MF-1]|uniref:Uncharacterized protein n=1 Tax=Austropuccinia psidii MF-1 TaxID=1389203 RepID=A0A9Q3CXZ1_9BASI|nr:hypothetical protein [Austropuccinia psidii MF-1]